MARPKTTGDVITFRLPLDLHVVAETLAGRAGTNVSDYVKGRISAGLEREKERLRSEQARPDHAEDCPCPVCRP